MKLSRLGLLSIPIAVMLSATAFAIPVQAATKRLQSSGKLTLLRVHNVGTKYGPPADQIDAEVIIHSSEVTNFLNINFTALAATRDRTNRTGLPLAFS